MSAYAHQMEREFSAPSLSSRGGSDTGSRYSVESGFYMTSFAATIFIAALVTVGVLLITLLVALTVMLQACQNKSAGVVEIVKSSDDYSFCMIFSLHAELNSLDADEFPSVCRVLAVRYIKEGQYTRDLNFTMRVVESYFTNITPLGDGLDVVLIDIDDIFTSPSYTNQLMLRLDQYGCSECIEEARHLKYMLTLKLYIKLRSSGWPVILLSRKPERYWNATAESLISAGYSGWSSLIMRLDNEMQMNSCEYFSKRRVAIQKEGFRITGVISSHMDALTGPCLGKRIFKLPNPLYYNFEHYIDSRKVSL